MTDSTLLVLTGVGVPPYSARGLTQTLEPIAQAAHVARTINGATIDLSATQFRKYRSTIQCSDQQAPAVDGVWPGAEVTVDCVAELSYPVGGTAQRPVVPGSSHVENEFVFYRPRLNMMVTTHTQSRDEWGATVAWSMDLEEI